MNNETLEKSLNQYGYVTLLALLKGIAEDYKDVHSENTTLCLNEAVRQVAELALMHQGIPVDDHRVQNFIDDAWLHCGRRPANRLEC